MGESRMQQFHQGKRMRCPSCSLLPLTNHRAFVYTQHKSRPACIGIFWTSLVGTLKDPLMDPLMTSTETRSYFCYNLGRLPWASPFEASVAGIFAAMCLGKIWTCCSTWVHSNAPQILETHQQFCHDKHRFQSKAPSANGLHTAVHAQQVSKVEKLKNEQNWRTNHANGSSLGCQVDLWRFSCSEMFASCSTG